MLNHDMLSGTGNELRELSHFFELAGNASSPTDGLDGLTISQSEGQVHAGALANSSASPIKAMAVSKTKSLASYKHSIAAIAAPSLNHQQRSLTTPQHTPQLSMHPTVMVQTSTAGINEPSSNDTEVKPSRRSSLQSTYANYFDYNAYMSRIGTPDNEDTTKPT